MSDASAETVASRPQPQARAAAVLAGAALLLAVAAWLCAPLLGAGFLGDDWTFIAMSRFTDAPWRFYVDDYSSTYFHRPHGMVLWWLTVAAFDNGAAGHYATNAAVHLLNAVLLALAVRRFAGWRIAGAFAALFALHPIGIGTAAWLSDRFDLLATTGMLWGVIALERALAGRAGYAWMWLAWALALGSKETGLALGGWLLLRVAFEAQLPGRTRAGLGAIVVGLALGYLALRQAVLVSPSAAGLLNDPLRALATGSSNWFATLPAALGGGTAWIGAVLVLAALLVVARGAAAGRGAWPLLLPALALFLAPAVLQSPVTRVGLDAAALANSTNYRFYYLALAALLLLLAVALRSRPRRTSPATMLVALVAAAVLAMPARDIALRWSASTAIANRGPLAAAAAAIVALDPARLAPPCRIAVLGLEGDPDLPRVADTALKGMLPPAHPAQACAISAELASWVTLVRGGGCTDDAWQPFVPRPWEGKPAPTRTLPGFCLAVLADPGPADALAAAGVVVLDLSPGAPSH